MSKLILDNPNDFISLNLSNFISIFPNRAAQTDKSRDWTDFFPFLSET